MSGQRTFALLQHLPKGTLPPETQENVEITPYLKNSIPKTSLKRSKKEQQQDNLPKGFNQISNSLAGWFRVSPTHQSPHSSL